MKIPNFILGSQVWNGAIITSSLCIWATCRFLTALDSQAWAIARLGVKQACKLAFQLRMEHFGSQDDIMWHLTHVCEWAKGCTILLLHGHLRDDTGTAVWATRGLKHWAGLTLPPSVGAASWHLEKQKEILLCLSIEEGTASHRPGPPYLPYDFSRQPSIRKPTSYLLRKLETALIKLTKCRKWQDIRPGRQCYRPNHQMKEALPLWVTAAESQLALLMAFVWLFNLVSGLVFPLVIFAIYYLWFSSLLLF